MDNEIVVTIRCLVYNHEPFLRQCLDGFVMQKTNFRFEAIVHDDASTDGSADIIREYASKFPDIIKPIIETENQYSKKDGSLTRIMNEHSRGKYIASCEGDDCWIDPYKLQKQVDILENNKEFGCVFTAYQTINVNGELCDFQPSIRNMNRSFSGDVFYELLKANFPQTLTVVYQKELLSNNFNPPYLLDYSLFLSLAIQKKFYYLPEVTGYYRINPAGLVQTGELGRIYDFTSIQIYYFVEYLKNKQYKRAKIEDKRIKKLLLTEWCHVWMMLKYYKYFMKIVRYYPLSLILIPLCLFRRMIKSDLFKIKY